MRYVKAFGRFWYDFVVGDDWKIAAAVVTTLAIGAVVAAAVEPGRSWLPVAVGAGVALAFSLTVWLDVRRQ